MANITNEINNINTAIYGKDVRSALSNGLTVMNDEIEDMGNDVSNMDTKVKTLGQTVSSSVLDIQGLKNQTEANMTNTQNALNEVNNIISEAQKNGTIGLSLGGGTLTGPLNLADGGAGLKIDGTTILSIDSNNRVVLNGSGNTSSGQQLGDTFNDGSFDNTGRYKIKGATVISLDGNNNLCINSADKTNNGSKLGYTYNNSDFDNFGTFKIKGARVLYLDSHNNLWLNSNDSTENGIALGTTFITGGLSIGGNIDISEGYSLTLNNEKVLSREDEGIGIYNTTAATALILGKDKQIYCKNGEVESILLNSFNLKDYLPNTINIKTSINANDDLNNYLTSGIYYSLLNSTMLSVKNSPTTFACCLEVIQCAYSEADTSNGFVYQRMIDMNGSVWFRTYYAYGKTWSNWMCAAGNQRNSTAQLMALGKVTTNISLENTNLKMQNVALGNQVTNLAIENKEMKEQMKTLAQTMINQQLGGK